MNWKIYIYCSMALMCYTIKNIDGANILVVMPLPARSHFKSFQPLWEDLVKRGHYLTIVAGYKLNDEFQTHYTLIDVKPYFNELKIVFAEMKEQNSFQNFIFCHDAIQNYMEIIFKLPQIQDLIDSKEKYDVVIAEMFYMDAIFAFGYKFNAPVIAVSAQNLISYYNWILSNPFPASYIPNSFLPYTEKMSLRDRFVNMAFNFISVLFYEFVSLPRSQRLMEKYFHFDETHVPHMKDIMKNISVTLVNFHYSFGYVKPQLPNVVDVAGLHFTPLKSLPQNIREFMDGAECGVVYLSLGSLIEPHKVEHLGNVFVSILEKIPERVIMKWDPKLLSHIPTNILVQEWVSQVDVLNHPNCRLFITHGGLHSILESLNASVPLIGVPFFADQKFNMAIVEYYEIGATVKFDQISDQLLPKIDQVLRNPTYRKNIQKRSQLFRDRLASPLDTAVYWVEHTIERKNTDHLKPASSHIYWYELYSLDVFLIFAVSVLILIKIITFMVGIINNKFACTPTISHNNGKSCKKKKEI